jgi:hypothetical protein
VVGAAPRHPHGDEIPLRNYLLDGHVEIRKGSTPLNVGLSVAIRASRPHGVIHILRGDKLL